MYLEAYLAFNCIADFVLLCAVSRALGLFSWRRALAADALCAAWSALAAARPSPWASPPAQLALLALASMLLTGAGSLRLWPVAGLSLCAAALLCGGAARLAALPGPAAGAAGIAAGAALLSLLFAARPPGLSGWQVSVCLDDGGRTARFPALIDTGNRLREPRSGLPVLIAEAALLKGLMPESGYRTLRFGGVGGNGEMPCFKPKSIWIERGGRRRRAPDAWVAISPGPLPGLCQALAPSEFASYAK